ncbi:TFIID-31kDa-domain-containing protein [Backusella circina FSU 941]|nr:TFIID-31kDa-domain-containing protein [Backusella circina FSU 941]
MDIDSENNNNAKQLSNKRLDTLILQTLGVKSYDPKVMTELLDFAHQYTTNIFQDAVTYSQHASKDEVDLQDIQLAIQERVNTSFTAAPPKEFLSELAHERNKNALPLISEKYGVRLPSDKHCLTGINYSIAPDGRMPVKTAEKLSLDIDASDVMQSHEAMKRRREEEEEEEDDEEEF